MTFTETFLSPEHIAAAGLRVIPLIGPGQRKRLLVVTPHIERLLNGEEQVRTFPHVEADLLTSTFMAGQMVTVSRHSAMAELEQLEGLDDVWALCFRKPKPGWRMFGRFARRDVLVLLSAHDREALGVRGSYSAAANQTIIDWNRLLPGVTPLRSANLNDYLSGAYRNVDEE